MSSNEKEPEELKIRPGYLVVIKSSLRGGVRTSREQIDHHRDGAADVSEWKSKKRIEDAEEHKLATQVRDKCRAMIKSACYWTPFGEVCPDDMVQDYYRLAKKSEDSEGEWSDTRFHLKRGDDGWVVEDQDSQVRKAFVRLSNYGDSLSEALARRGGLEAFQEHVAGDTVTPEVYEKENSDRDDLVEYVLGELGYSAIIEDGACLSIDLEGDDSFILHAGEPSLQVKISDSSLVRRIEQARAIEEEFNAEAVHTTVSIKTLRGKIAKDEAEAINSVAREIKELLGDMDEAVCSGNVKAIRDLASKASTMGKLLSQKQTSQVRLKRAVAAARKIASVLVKKVEKGGEELAEILASANTSPIAVARFSFGDEDVEVDEEELTLEESMPSIATHRFSSLDSDEPTSATLFGNHSLPDRE